MPLNDRPFETDRPETFLAQGGSRWDVRTGGVSMPIHQATTFRHPGIGESTGFDYSRTSNPTRATLEEVIAKLEGGARALAFSSGMAAIDCVLRLFKAGDRIVVLEDLYGGTWRILETVFRPWGLNIQYITHEESLDPKFLQGLAPFQGFFLETPTNPTLKVVDIAACAQVAKKHGAVVVVDNTFMTALLQRPLELGADIVLYSASKYIGGHNDVLAGLAVAGSVELGNRLAILQNTSGAVLGPWDSWLLIRGLKTLPLRIRQQQENAHILAEWLGKHPAVAEVHFPGSPNHSGYEIHRKQARGAGAMLSFSLHNPDKVAPFLSKVKLWILAESLGGVESLITLPVKQTHADVPELLRNRLGVTSSLLRLSVGIEFIDDLIRDLAQALNDTQED